MAANMQININVPPEVKAQLQAAAASIKAVTNALKGMEATPATKAATAIKEVGDKAATTGKEVEVMSERMKAANRGFVSLGGAIQSVTSAVRTLVGAFIGLEIFGQFKEMAEAAAKADRMKMAMEQLAVVSGVTVKQIDQVDKNIQKMGYTAEQSRQFLTRYMQANLDLNKAEATAALAQNLSVASGRSYAQVLQQLTFAMQTGRAMSLIHLGIVVDTKRAYADFAHTIGVTAGSLDKHQQALAVQNAVLKEGVKFNDLYANSLKTAGGQMLELPQLIAKVKDSFGESLQPAFAAVVGVAVELLKQLNLMGDDLSENEEGAQKLGAAIKKVGDFLVGTVKFLGDHHKAIMDIVIAYGSWKLLMNPILTGLISLVGWLNAAGPAAAVAATGIDGVAAAEGVATTNAMALGTALRTAWESALGPLGLVVAGVTALTAGLFAARRAYDQANDPGGLKLAAFASGIQKMKEYISSGQALKDKMAGHMKNLDYFVGQQYQDFQKNGVPQAGNSSEPGSPEQVAAALRAKLLKEEQDAQQKATDSLLKNGQETQYGFQSAGGMQANNYLRALHQKDIPDNMGDDAMRAAIQNAAKSVQTKGDLADFRNALDTLRSTKTVSAAVLGDMKLALAVAADHVHKESQAFGSDLVNHKKEMDKANAEVAVNSADFALSMQKIADKKLEDENKAAYEKGKLGLTEYYQARQGILDRAYQAEQDLEIAKITQLAIAERDARTPEEKKQIGNQIIAAKNKALQGTAQKEVDDTSLQLEKQRDIAAVQKKITELSIETLKTHDELAGTLAGIDEKYKELLISMHLGTSESDQTKRNLVEAARDAEKFKEIIGDLAKTYDELNARQKSLLNLQKAQIDAAAGNGTINSGQKQNLDNQLIVAQQKQNQVEQAQNLEQIRHLKADGYAEESKDIQDLETKNMDLQAQYITLGGQIKTYGQEIRDSFTGSVSEALSSMMMDMGHAQNALVNLGRSLQKTFADMAAKKLSSMFTTSLVNSTSKIDPKTGQPIAGTSVFDKIGSVFGFGDKGKLDGSTEAKALYVKIAGLEAMLSATHGMPAVAGGAQGLLSGAKSLTGAASDFAGGNVSGGMTALSGLAKGIPGLMGFGAKTASSVLDGSSVSGVGPLSPSAVDYGTAVAQLPIDVNGGNDVGPLDSSSLLGLSQKMFGFAKGGTIRGPGHDTSDNIHALLSPGEHITNAAQTRKWGRLLKAINNDTLNLQSIAIPAMPRFAAGGFVGGAGGGVGVGSSGPSGFTLQLHPDFAKTTLGDWFNNEVARQYAGR
jgi:hypothetical protein